MPTFECIIATDPLGLVLRRESVAAQSLNAADRRLIASGSLPVVAARATEFVEDHQDELAKKRIPLKHARMALKYLESGARMQFPLHRSLAMAERAMPNKVAAEILRRITKRVTMGSRFSETLPLYAGFLDESVAGIIAAAEGTRSRGGSGDLQEAFRQAGLLLDTRIAFQTAVRRALVYPAILVVAACALVALLCIRVIPEFAKIFSELGSRLPWETRMVMDLSDFVVNHPVLFFGGLAAFFTLLGYVPKFIRQLAWLAPQIGLRVHGWLLKMKGIGQINRLNLEISFTRVVLALQKNQTPLLEALALVQNLSWNLCYRSAVARLRRALDKGESIGTAVDREALVFLPEFRAAVQFGSESNNLEDPLQNRLEMAQEEFKTLADAIQELILPVLLIIIGIVVFVLAAACMRPIFDMADAVKP